MAAPQWAGGRRAGAAFGKKLRGGRFTLSDIDGDDEFEAVGAAFHPSEEVVASQPKRIKVQAAAGACAEVERATPSCQEKCLTLDDAVPLGRTPSASSSATSDAPAHNLRGRPGKVASAQLEAEVDDAAKANGRAGAFGGLERRKLVRDRLKEALGDDSIAEKLAEKAEATLFKVLHLGPQYNRQVRSVLFNLRGDAGPEFRGALRSGGLSAESLASLSAEDMASSAKRAEREQLRREAMEACEADWELRHDTVPLNGTFTCGKCSGNRTWYFQFQTRACDEPMEFFVMCRDCHHGWRHNDVAPDDIFRQVWS